jgi:hypothetical protein
MNLNISTGGSPSNAEIAARNYTAQLTQTKMTPQQLREQNQKRLAQEKLLRERYPRMTPRQEILFLRIKDFIYST